MNRQRKSNRLERFLLVSVGYLMTALVSLLHSRWNEGEIFTSRLVRGSGTKFEIFTSPPRAW